MDEKIAEIAAMAKREGWTARVERARRRQALGDFAARYDGVIERALSQGIAPTVIAAHTGLELDTVQSIAAALQRRDGVALENDQAA